MANKGQLPDRPDQETDDDIRELLRRANPNPARVGCPPRDVLIELARLQRPFEDAGYDHLVKCSPCYVEFEALQQAAAGQAGGVQPAVAQPVRTKWLLPAAAAVLVVVASVWFVLSQGQESVDQPPPQAVRAELDLRQYTVERSDQVQPEQRPPLLPRRLLNVTMLLPVGSEPGEYELQVLDSQLRPRASANGKAVIRDYVTTFQARLDLRELTPGSYQLALRRSGEDWHLYPATVE